MLPLHDRDTPNKIIVLSSCLLDLILLVTEIVPMTIPASIVSFQVSILKHDMTARMSCVIVGIVSGVRHLHNDGFAAVLDDIFPEA